MAKVKPERIGQSLGLYCIHLLEYGIKSDVLLDALYTPARNLQLARHKGDGCLSRYTFVAGFTYNWF
jgi:hypothetical protein